MVCRPVTSCSCLCCCSVPYALMIVSDVAVWLFPLKGVRDFLLFTLMTFIFSVFFSLCVCAPSCMALLGHEYVAQNKGSVLFYIIYV